MIEISGVRKKFNTNGASFEALKGVDLFIEKGEFASITGPSGSGKSTLLCILGGITHPTEGTVMIDTIPVHDLSVERLSDFRREYIGFVFQQFHLIPYLSTVENVMLPLSITGLKDGEQLEMAMDCLESVGLKDKARSIPSQLSGGEQQRVAIARAIVNKPPIVIADEPTGNLDTATGEEILGLFCRLNEKGHTVLIVTHDPKIASKTRRIIGLKDGLIQ